MQLQESLTNGLALQIVHARLCRHGCTTALKESDDIGTTKEKVPKFLPLMQRITHLPSNID